MRQLSIESLLAAPLASLFLILTLIPICLRQTSSGTQITLTHLVYHRHDFDDCLDDHRLYLQIHPRQMVSVNESVLPAAEGTSLLKSALNGRPFDPNLWILVDSNATMQDLASALDIPDRSHAGMNVLLITRQEVRDSLHSGRGYFSFIPNRQTSLHRPSACVLPPSAYEEIR